MKKRKDRKAHGKHPAGSVDVSDTGSGEDAPDRLAAGEPVGAATPGPSPTGEDAQPSTGDEARSDQPAQPEDPVQALQARVEQLEEKLARARADLQNAQKRHAIERSQAIRYANAEVMKSLLGVLDDFERSLEAAQTSSNLEAVVDGVRLVYENLTKALRDHGLEPIPALHEPFDPEVHEALLQERSQDYPPGTVVQEVARGYRLRDRVVRPSKVIVSKKPEEEAGAAGPDGAESKP
jgi:molecular chaperone GrpE